MPRRKRKVSATGMYHVFVRGINREYIFNQVREKNYLKKIIRKHLSKYDVEIYAYCIMSNHTHLIIKSKQLTELSMFMSKVLAEYAIYYNFKKKRNGHVFQNRFNSEVIDDNTYFWNCLRYIHMNPVKANMTSSAFQYKYSSIHDYKSGNTSIIHKNAHEKYHERFDTWEKYLEFHNMHGKGVFLDVAEERELRYREVARSILWEMQENESVNNAMEIIEEPELREIYIMKLSEELDVSRNKAKIIYKEIEKSLLV